MESERFTHNGREYEMRIERDEDHGAPWDEEDGHGPVSGWERRDKRPGEMILSEDHGARRFYDFAEACRIARRDGWGFLPAALEIEPAPADHVPYSKRGGWAKCAGFIAHDPDDINDATRAVYDHFRAKMTAREYAAAAALRDFERLRAWCDDRWFYVGVIVAPVCPCCGEPDENSAESLWGIESDAGEYLQDVARDLADQIAANDETAAA